MRRRRKNEGFSLTEVLLSVGILTVGLIFVAGVFPVGIHFATIASERTIGAVVADEAFAKIRLYGVDVNDLTRWPGEPTQPLDINRTLACVDFNDVSAVPLHFSEFAYPSTGVNISEKKFYWSALCRRKDPSTSLVQVTVFVYRKIGGGKRYWERDLMTNEPLQTAFPKPIKVAVTSLNPTELLIRDLAPPPSDNIDEASFINDDCTIVDDRTGQRFRVLERYISATDDDIILLDGNWLFNGERLVWVVPPPAGGGRNPCIAIYQKEIQF